jgi:riboflavin transporter FmnP
MLEAGTRHLAVTLSWLGPAGRMLIAIALTFGLLAVVTIYLVAVPKSSQPATWAQSMAGAVLVFALFILGYGVIPSEWIIFANAYLQWDNAHFIIEQNEILPFDITQNVARDLVAVLIYVFFLGTTLTLWSLWQKRKTAEERAEASAAAESSGTSAYGRPVTRKA